MLVDIAELNYMLYYSVTFFLLGFSAILLKRQIWNLFDPIIPMLVYVMLNVAIVFYFYVLHQVNLSIMAYVFLSYLFFLFGLKTRLTLPRFGGNISGYYGPTRKFTIYLLLISCLCLIINAAFVYSKIGFGLITGAANPGDRNSMTLGGFGIYKYISWLGTLLIVPVSLHVLYVFKMKYRFIAICFFYIFIQAMTNASKLGMIPLLFGFGTYAYYVMKSTGVNIISRRIISICIFIAILSPLLVFLNYVSRTQQSMAIFFLNRIVDTGGGTYSYFVMKGYSAFNDLSFADRISQFLDTLLSVPGLKEWAVPNRIAMLTQYNTGTYQEGFGQNPYMFLDGHFLFGWFGIAYCFVLGVAICAIRRFNTDVLTFYFLNSILLPIIADPDITQAYIISLMLLLPFLIFFLVVSKSSGCNCMKRWMVHE